MKKWFSKGDLRREGQGRLEAGAVKVTILRASVEPGCGGSKEALSIEVTSEKKCYRRRNVEEL